VDRNTETVILRVFDRTGMILETQELFANAYFTHKLTYAYLLLFMGSWNMQEHWDSDQFCFGDGRICGVFPPLFVFCIKALGLATFLIVPKNCIS